MKVRWSSKLALGIVLASSTVGCAARPPRDEAAARATREPARCGPNRVGAGWPEMRSTIAPASFCVPPDLRLAPGKTLYAPPRSQLPYPQARSRVEAWEEWKAPDGRTAMETSLHAGPDEPHGWSRGATEVRDTTVAAGCSGGVAVLKTYRVPAVWNSPTPGAGGRVDTHNAYIELPLRPMTRLTLEVAARDTVERARLIPILQSACVLDDR